MRLELLAVGDRMPDWVRAGYEEYARRMPRECSLLLREIGPGARGRPHDPARAVAQEGERLLQAVPKGARVVTLEVDGCEYTTEDLARRLAFWRGDGRDVALLVGGPDGLAPSCLALADERWSLSRLTLPHPLVRVVLAEQLYRAWTILNQHPYHRA